MVSTCPLGHTGATSQPEHKGSTPGVSSTICPLHHSGPESSATWPATSKAGLQSNSSTPGPVTPMEAVPQLCHVRVESSIPSANGQPFLYPSERQFYGSATAKGHSVRPQDMGMVVAIHNAVNERAWQEILRFERLHANECDTSKLLRFVGRPGDLSPKARLAGLLGRTLPFDRHDWHVDRCGTQVRYVIDFYDGKPSPAHPVSIHIDARPEMSWEGLRDRIRLWAQDLQLF
eukprot:CAMPEP_0179123100 /NCGR_PEP_ID=MMETSP0796-20121207/58126_1 /TAXON_ID=73915 /ORGANISM="Pyrodinium bahamense, Strain pbaha01" /LENGTH=231 /DNA_ID=CAMNT_0020821741 /DNA_START=59 /DNA_END=754 /DNA_ORIENTATION=-